MAIFYDTCNPDGDYNTFPFNEYINGLKLSTKPLFRVEVDSQTHFGSLWENDEYCYGDINRIIDVFKTQISNKDLFDFRVIKSADHGFDGHEEELARFAAQWLVK